MLPSRKTQLNRMTACLSDLTENGINPDALGPRALCDLARRNLEYFQTMLGYEAGLREVVALIDHTRDCTRPRSHAGTERLSP